MTTLFFWLPILAQTPIGNPNQFNQYLLLGYAVMWLIAFLYLLNLASKQRNLRQEIRLMRRLLDEARLEEDEADAAS